MQDNTNDLERLDAVIEIRKDLAENPPEGFPKPPSLKGITACYLLAAATLTATLLGSGKVAEWKMDGQSVSDVYESCRQEVLKQKSDGETVEQTIGKIESCADDVLDPAIDAKNKAVFAGLGLTGMFCASGLAFCFTNYRKGRKYEAAVAETIQQRLPKPEAPSA